MKKIQIIIHSNFYTENIDLADHFLLKNSSGLEKGRACYWGKNLELAPIKLYPWQKPGVNLRAVYKENTNFLAEFEKLLIKSIELEKLSGKVNRVIINNDWFCSNGDFLFKLIKKNVFNIKVLFFVDSIYSAVFMDYKSWGLNHKTYKGPVVDINEFSIKRQLTYFKEVVSCLKLLKAKVDIIHSPSIAQGLSNAFEIPSPNNITSTASRGSNEELYLRCIFNNFRNGESKPSDFNKKFDLGAPQKFISPSEFQDLSKLSGGTLKKIIENNDDLEVINSFLVNSDQKPIQALNKSKLLKIDEKKLLQLLLNIFTKQCEVK
jgi:hypothetical protein